jgi:hypothetical protein
VNNVFLQPQIKSELIKLLRNIKKYDSIKSEVLVSSKAGLCLHTRFQFFFNLKPESALEAKLYELILNYALEAEKFGPGAFDTVIQLLAEYSEKIEKDIPLSDFAKNIQTTADIKPTSLSDVNGIVINRLEAINSTLGALFFEAIKLAGFGGRIIIEKTHSQKPSIELNCGYTFEVKPAWPLSVKLDNPKILVIDGFIESVSEIHHILEKQFETKQSSIIFARGMAPDVISTLRVNFDRGSLKTVPVIVNFDLEGINTINDIAVVSGGDVISSNKGNLISSIDYNTIKAVNSAVIYPTKVVLQHNQTSRAVSAHTTFLKNKRNENSSIEDVGKLYDKRIRSLSSNHVLMRIPDNKDYVIAAQSIDIGLRTLKSMIDYGCIEKNGKKMPAALDFATDIFLKKCLKSVLDLGAAILD